MSTLSQRITLKMLRYFHQVAQCQQFSQAAEQLNITKSPLSAQIKELEHALGVVLFERDTRNVRLTTAGKQLNQECERIFDVLETSLNRVTQSAREEQATLNLGLMSSIFWAGFGDALHQLQQANAQSAGAVTGETKTGTDATPNRYRSGAFCRHDPDSAAPGAQFVSGENGGSAARTTPFGVP